MSNLLLLAALILSSGLPSDGAPGAPLAAEFACIAAGVGGTVGWAAFDYWAGAAQEAQTGSPR